MLTSKSERGLRAEPLDARPAEVRPRDRRRLPDVRRDGHRRHEVPRHELRDHRLPAGGPEGQAGQRRAACCSRRTRPATSPATWPALVGQGQGRRPGHLLGRRPEDPAGRRLHRRLPGRREGGQPGHQDAQRLLAGLRRPGEVQGDRAQPDRGGRAGRLPGRRPVRPRRARRGQGEGRLGHRRRRRPGLPRRSHPHLGPEEGRRGGVRDGQGRPGRHLQGRRGPDLRPQVRRRRPRQAERRGLEVRRPGRGGQAEDQVRRDHATSRPRSSRHGRTQRRCPATRSPSSCAGSPSGSARWSRTTRSTSSCGVGRSTRCSGRTGPASRP